MLRLDPPFKKDLSFWVELYVNPAEDIVIMDFYR